jgi:hypothetical protein
MQVERQMDSGIVHFIGPKMAFREGAAGPRFEISFERHGCVLSDKCKVRNHEPTERISRYAEIVRSGDLAIVS